MSTSETSRVDATPPGALPNTFGALLRRRREQAGLSLEELAERSGLAAKGIGALERGERRRPYPNTVRALVAALALTAAERAEWLAAISGRASPSSHALDESLPVGASTVLAPRGLPHLSAVLIGRDEDLAGARTLLEDEEVRLVTFTGPGGVGKTSLALRAAEDLRDRFPDGVGFVSLAPLTDPELVVPEIAASLGMQDGGTRPLRETLYDRRFLLVLDNVERLLAAAPEIADLLASCPRLVVLATSRAPLRVRGEREYPVAPLGVPLLDRVPSVAEVAVAPAVALFTERARAACPDFTLTRENATAVAAICRRLEGLPLALELAAAQVRALTPTVLLARLDHALPLLTGGARDLPDRQRTMRDTIAWSHDLLAEADRMLFRRLSVFAGGWTLDAAEVVGVTADFAASSPVVDVFESLSSLVEQSLVVAAADDNGELRYRLLEPVREFARESLEQAAEAADAAYRHASYYVALAEQAAPELRGSRQVEWLDCLDRENDNLRAAMSWALGRGEIEISTRLGWLLHLFWWFRGYQAEGRHFMEQALAQMPALAPRAHARALCALGVASYGAGDHERTLQLFSHSSTLFEEASDGAGQAYVLAGAGVAAMLQGNLALAADFMERSLEQHRLLSDGWMINQTSNYLGLIRLGQGDATEASRHFENALGVARETGDRWGLCLATYNLARLAQVQCDEARAAHHFRDSLLLARDVGNVATVAYCLEGLAGVATRDHPAIAARLYGAAEALRSIAGTVVYAHTPDSAVREGAIATARAGSNERAWSAAWAEGHAMSLEDAVAYASTGF